MTTRSAVLASVLLSPHETTPTCGDDSALEAHARALFIPSIVAFAACMLVMVFDPPRTSVYARSSAADDVVARFLGA